MAYRSHARAEVNPDNPRAFAICQRCNIQTNLYKLQWQFEWSGFTLYNTGLLVCDECLDRPAQFLRSLVLPPDPPPLFNVRPENYTVDEEGPTVDISCYLPLGLPAITTLYLDLYDAPPDEGGASVLETLTDSATRTDWAASMGSPVDNVSANTADILFVQFASESADIRYLAVFDAATGGTLVASAAIGVPTTIVTGSGCQIPIGSLQVLLT